MVAKRGPKPKLTAANKARVLDLLALGMSLVETLLLAGCSRRTLTRACRGDKKFARGVKGAGLAGKEHHLRRVAGAEERWQASAWFLERKWGQEYGQKVKLEHGGRVEVVEEVIGHVGHAQAAPHQNGNGTASPGAGRVPGL